MKVAWRAASGSSRTSSACGFLQECLREWNGQGLRLTAADLAAQCLETPPEGPYFHADETTYLAPGNMVERINAGLRAAGFPEERRPPELAAIIFRSLARRYADGGG